ncbi:TIGR02186 family protein [Maricaulis sp.]|uniref:TIGR02186 family protein n=1 Tax=Maricaulis sp. TaxID=1486257 RepID=UPI0026065A28|nr:TIGR02186 family protein [Maricaulis sp.]
MLAALVLALALQGQPVQSLPQEAPGIVAALTHETVEIREDFAGQELILYGATRGLTIRDEIVVVLRGPGRDLRVMRKERNFGIWINSAPLEFDEVPSYYAIATSLPLNEIATPEELANSGIGLPATLAITAAPTIEATARDVSPYLAAIARSGERNNLYASAQRGVEVLDGGLFRASLSLPPLTPVGNYVAEVYLFRDGRVIASRSARLRVEKAGLERLIFEFAHDWPWFYGLFCVVLAMLAGYVANVAFSRR